MLRRVLESSRVRRLASYAPEALKKAAVRVAERPRRPSVGWGDFRRTEPFSATYGFDRGTPIDRFYIDRFLGRFSGDIRGAVLEVRDTTYAERFGGGMVDSIDVLDIDSTNIDATVVADLAVRGSLPARRFDCFILLQTLQYVSSPTDAIANAWASLRPDGRLLLTAPALSMLDPTAGIENDLWRFTPAGLRALAGAALPAEAAITVGGLGNALAATAFLMGLASEEVTELELTAGDDAYPVLSWLRIVRPA